MEYYLGNDEGDTVLFRFSSTEIQTVDTQLWAVAGALEAFSHLIQPIAIDLWLVCRKADSPYLEPEVLPVSPGWFICETPSPPGVELMSHIPRDRIVSTAPEITESTLTTWFEEIVQKSIASPGYLLSIETVRIEHTWLCVEGNTPPQTSLPSMRLSHGVLPIPCEQRNAKSWAAGPIDELMLPAPAAIEFLNHDGCLFACFRFYWRGILRSTDSSRVSEPVQKALWQMSARGWTLTTPEELGGAS